MWGLAAAVSTARHAAKFVAVGAVKARFSAVMTAGLFTADHVLQVFSVLSTLCPALGLTACLACGKAGLAAEAELLAAGGIGEPSAAGADAGMCYLS